MHPPVGVHKYRSYDCHTAGLLCIIRRAFRKTSCSRCLDPCYFSNSDVYVYLEQCSHSAIGPARNIRWHLQGWRETSLPASWPSLLAAKRGSVKFMPILSIDFRQYIDKIWTRCIIMDVEIREHQISTGIGGGTIHQVGCGILMGRPNEIYCPIPAREIAATAPQPSGTNMYSWGPFYRGNTPGRSSPWVNSYSS